MAHQEFPIIITEKAKAMAERATKAEGDNEKLFLRISVRGGGCAGLQYNLDIDDQSSHFDVWSQFGELKIASDVFSLRYLANTTVDYQETLEGAGFKFDNPNARRTCGCGSSFS
ncbi:MAG: iron-sulfur cluster assembly accessory protein [Myxococcales bacterium]|nr:MAG: iron-sulfur cluster assembly accessory protein [Myxococcales bacterium]